VKGPECEIDPDVKNLIHQALEKGKVIGAICIAPATVAKALEGSGRTPKMTIGTDQDTCQALQKMGTECEMKEVSEITVDEENKIVSTPAYMLGPSISHVALGIKKLVDKVLEM
jgi:enhancing lycopene biosynthesis protein 2